MRKDNYDASHICWAYRIYENSQIQQHSSDAGEPSGTAGIPILRELKRNGFIQIKRFWDEVLYYRNVGIVSHPKYARSAWTPEKAEAARLKKEEVPRMAYCLDDD